MGQVYAGRYELVDVLGSGGMGDVWRAWDRREQRYCAAKVLRQSDSASLLRFVRESSWRIEHPHIVVPTGWVGEDDQVLFAMPIVSGGSVATVLSDHGTVPWSWARPVLEQVLDALATVHEAGIVHRDVKPANVLLRPTGSAEPFALLSDFGIAWHRDEPRLTRATESIGTQGYQAPEAVLGGDPAPAQDLYAVGVLARQMLGEVPVGSVLERLLDDDPARRPDAVSARAELAHVRLTDPDGEPVEVFDQLPPWPNGWGDTGPVSAPPPPPQGAPRQRSPRRTIRRETVVAAVLGVVGVALLVAAAIAW